MVLAALFPGLYFLTRGQIMNGFACLFLQATIIGWLPASVWAMDQEHLQGGNLSFKSSYRKKKRDSALPQ